MDVARVERAAFARVWVLATVAGETSGFAVAAMAGAVVALPGPAPAVTYGLMVVAGVVEGTLLGLGQAYALRRFAVPVRPRRWVVATAAAAGLAWSIGMLPATLLDLGVGIDVGRPEVLAGAGLLGLLLLGSIPVAQYLVLRPLGRRTWRWVPLTMGAWAVALAWTAAPSPLVDEQTPIGVILAAYLLAGLAMAVTVAVITAVGGRRLLLSLRPQPTAGPGAARPAEHGPADPALVTRE